MQNIQFLLIRLQLLILSPLFHFLLLFTLFFLLKSFDSPLLCDSKFIEEINLEIENYKDDYYLYEYWKNKADEEELNSIIDSDEEEMGWYIERCYKNADTYLEKAKESLIRVRTLELDIKRIDPRFKSKLARTALEIKLMK